MGIYVTIIGNHATIIGIHWKAMGTHRKAIRAPVNIEVKHQETHKNIRGQSQDGIITS